MRFRATIQLAGRTATGIQVPAEVVDTKAATFFDSLTYSQKRWYVEPIEQAKKAETRERRIARALDMLREGRKR
jgi:uncharacterized protein YdeI (YjbR/CyaY-like superfamily)